MGRYVRYVDWVLLLLVTVGCYWLNEQADNEFELRTKYHPGWVYGVSLLVPLLTAIYFTRRYHLFDGGKIAGSMPVMMLLVGFLFLMDALPQFVLLANVPKATSAAALQELDVTYVKRHYAKTTYTGSTIGIQYGDKVLRFESSRTNYFLLRNKRCIRADIGQAAPGFYYIRNLQLAPGERRQASVDFWSDWGRGTALFVGICGAFGLLAWVVSLLFGKHLKKIRL